MHPGSGLRYPGFLEICLLLQRYFCMVYDYVGKAGLSKGYVNPKRKLTVTCIFQRLFELKFEKRMPYILCILKLF